MRTQANERLRDSELELVVKTRYLKIAAILDKLIFAIFHMVQSAWRDMKKKMLEQSEKKHWLDLWFEAYKRSGLKSNEGNVNFSDARNITLGAFLKHRMHTCLA